MFNKRTIYFDGDSVFWSSLYDGKYMSYIMVMLAVFYNSGHQFARLYRMKWGFSFVVVVISDSSIVTGAILYVDSLSLWDFHDGWRWVLIFAEYTEHIDVYLVLERCVSGYGQNMSILTLSYGDS